MVLVQLVLFFILGAAVSAFILALFVPLAWRRALYFADKMVRSEIPLSLDEVEAAYDFARAAHMLDMRRMEEKLEAAKQREWGAKRVADKAKEQIVYLMPFEQESALLQNQIIQQKNDLSQLVAHRERIENKMRQMAKKSADDAKKLKKLAARNTNIKLLKRERATLRQCIKQQTRELDRDRKTILEHQATIKALSRAEQDRLAALRQEMKITAARIVAAIALEEGQDSAILRLVHDNIPEEGGGDESLGAAIYHAIQGGQVEKS